jgi:hypothetical protein
VIDNAPLGCAIAFTRLRVRLMFGESEMKVAARAARVVPASREPWLTR